MKSHVFCELIYIAINGQLLIPTAFSSVLISISPSKLKVIYIICNVSVHTSKKTKSVSVTKISWLVLVKELISVYSESRTKYSKTLFEIKAEIDIVIAGGTYSYHWI